MSQEVVVTPTAVKDLVSKHLDHSFKDKAKHVFRKAFENKPNLDEFTFLKILQTQVHDYVWGLSYNDVKFVLDKVTPASSRSTVIGQYSIWDFVQQQDKPITHAIKLMHAYLKRRSQEAGFESAWLPGVYRRMKTIFDSSPPFFLQYDYFYARLYHDFINGKIADIASNAVPKRLAIHTTITQTIDLFTTYLNNPELWKTEIETASSSSSSSSSWSSSFTSSVSSSSSSSSSTSAGDVTPAYNMGTAAASSAMYAFPASSSLSSDVPRQEMFVRKPDVIYDIYYPPGSIATPSSHDGVESKRTSERFLFPDTTSFTVNGRRFNDVYSFVEKTRTSVFKPLGLVEDDQIIRLFAFVCYVQRLGVSGFLKLLPENDKTPIFSSTKTVDRLPELEALRNVLVELKPEQVPSSSAKLFAIAMFVFLSNKGDVVSETEDVPNFVQLFKYAYKKIGEKF